MKLVGKIIAGAVVAFAIILMIGYVVLTPESLAIPDAKRAVEGQLRDSNSADFQNIRVYHPDGEAITVCGEVNSRNGFGGMARYARFYYSNGVALIEDGVSSQVFDGIWTTGGCDGSKGSPKATQS